MSAASKRSGRISFVALAGVCSVALVLVLFLFTGQSPRSAAADFLSALATGNVNQLADLSVIHDKTREQRKQEWENTLTYAKNFIFIWDIVGITQDGDKAVVRLDVTKDAQNPTSYPEHFELNLVRKDGSWKVDVPQMARDMFPFLPR